MRFFFPAIIVVIAFLLVQPAQGVIPSARPASFPVRCEFWHDVPGAQITDTLATTELQRPFDGRREIKTMEFAPDFTDPWACSANALIRAPMTGRYSFNIAGRDSGILFLSTDESPEHRRYIAETPSWTDIHTYRWYSAQLSPVIELVAGHYYFIQAVGKSRSGPGGISIGWTMPDGKFEGPIPGARFAPYRGEVSVPDLRVRHLALKLDPPPLDPPRAMPPSTQPVNQFGIHRFVRGVHVDVDGDKQDLSYLMFFPHAYDTSADKVPMLIFLHGNSRQGYSLTGVEQLGPVKNIENDSSLREWMPMIVMCPQLPPDWRWDTPGAAGTVNALIDQLCRRYPRIDRSRIYLTGLSMGGKGTWLTLENSPDTYAAVAPISAVDVRPDAAPEMLKNIRNLHIICGGQDHGFTEGSQRMYAVLKPVLGDRVQLTVYPNEGHNVWEHHYAVRSFYEELLRYSR